MNAEMKTPLGYYGGKQKLVPIILPRLHEHLCYVEPFVGGAAIFFAKKPSAVEVINDTNSELINFYKVAQNNFVDLEAMIRVSLHSRKAHHNAKIMYDNPSLFTDVQRAWAVWVLSSQSFSAMLDGSWGYDKADGKTSRVIQGKKERFTEELAVRLQNVQVECADALYIIKSRDTADTLFYCDPPYYNSNCGHYNGYTIQDFENLLIALSEIKGKFLLSSYPSELLRSYSKRFKWQMYSVEKRVTVNAKSGYLKRKVEVLTANYPI